MGNAARHDRSIDLEEGLRDLAENLHEKSRRRWRQSGPTTGLTWGIELTGHHFISKARAYNVFDHDKAILEIGPGYGRLLRACLEQNVPFRNYVGIDISIENVTYLQKAFPAPNIRFIQEDIETVSLDATFDVVLSSLTFKHLYPSFEKALRNVVYYVDPGGVILFDLIEGENSYFENHGEAYIRWYTRSEIADILDRLSLELVNFDQVQHHPEFSRILVVARKLKVSESPHPHIDVKPIGEKIPD